MKVYLAVSGEYSDYRVQHVFARREDAEAYALSDDVEERDVQEGPVEVRAWHTLRWDPDIPEREGDSNHLANPYVSECQRDFDGRPGHVQHTWIKQYQFRPPRRHHLLVEGWDLQRVRKTFSEQRAQHIAG